MQKDKIIYFDVGSRNGLLELKGIAKMVEAYGFEPNPEEYKKLITNTTDIEVKFGIKSPEYKKLECFPYALGNKNYRDNFYITEAPTMSGELKPDFDSIKNAGWQVDKLSKMMKNFRKIEVEFKTIDSFCAEKSIENIDYLKIDVEGSEERVIQGAEKMINNVGIINMEVSFVRFREGQNLFSDMDIFMRNRGFELLAYEYDQNNIGYKILKRPYYYTPFGYADKFGKLMWANAIYINKYLSNENKKHKQALILREKGYIDEFLSLEKIRYDKKIDKQKFGNTSGQKFRNFGYYLVDKIYDCLKKIINIK